MKRISELFWFFFFFFSLYNHPAYLTLNVGPCSTVMLCVQGISAWGGWELGRSGWGWAWSTCLGGGGRGGTCSAHPGCSRSGRAHGAGPDPTDSSCRNRVLWGWQYWAEGVSCAVVLLDLVQSLLVQSRAFAWARSCKAPCNQTPPQELFGHPQHGALCAGKVLWGSLHWALYFWSSTGFCLLLQSHWLFLVEHVWEDVWLVHCAYATFEVYFFKDALQTPSRGGIVMWVLLIPSNRQWQSVSPVLKTAINLREIKCLSYQFVLRSRLIDFKPDFLYLYESVCVFASDFELHQSLCHLTQSKVEQHKSLREKFVKKEH